GWHVRVGVDATSWRVAVGYGGGCHRGGLGLGAPRAVRGARPARDSRARRPRQRRAADDDRRPRALRARPPPATRSRARGRGRRGPGERAAPAGVAMIIAPCTVVTGRARPPGPQGAGPRPPP